jgi:hypothetical protein
MKLLLRAFSGAHALMAGLFALAAFALASIAARMGWDAVWGQQGHVSAQQIIEAMGILAAAVVALQVAQTIAEEEVVRSAQVSGPTRVRRFLSRFLVVIVVALAVEALVATFRSAHEGSSQLVHAATMVLAIGVLLGGWGLFVRFNRSAEELEPEAMQDAKREDHKLR